MARPLSNAEIIKRLHEDLARHLSEEQDLPLLEIEEAIGQALLKIEDRSDIGWIYQRGATAAAKLGYTRAQALLWRLCTFIPQGPT